MVADVPQKEQNKSGPEPSEDTGKEEEEVEEVEEKEEEEEEEEDASPMNSAGETREPRVKMESAAIPLAALGVTLKFTRGSPAPETLATPSSGASGLPETIATGRDALLAAAVAEGSSRGGADPGPKLLDDRGSLPQRRLPRWPLPKPVRGRRERRRRRRSRQRQQPQASAAGRARRPCAQDAAWPRQC
ncbi:unnamed protein product [Prorocentrum cordatum]|uniref:Uncharacterized protein n=1 Tax=Prorocentrum cordatum TaxID=2364126 RepID=A0ABN9R2E8_9DINO|nr:unnamed protein product [Polarella glacialis]